MTVVVKISRDDALRLMAEAVAEKGEQYVYPRVNGGCTYVRDGQPSCLVGDALHRAGVGVDVLEALDSHGSIRWAEAALADFGIQLAPEAIDAFHRAQRRQDSGSSWGVALSAAQRYGR